MKGAGEDSESLQTEMQDWHLWMKKGNERGVNRKSLRLHDAKSKQTAYMQSNRSHANFMNVGRVGLQTEGKRVRRK